LDRNQITDVALSMFLGMDTSKYMLTYIDLFIISNNADAYTMGTDVCICTCIQMNVYIYIYII
jgi:hypothetical protein